MKLPQPEKNRSFLLSGERLWTTYTGISEPNIAVADRLRLAAAPQGPLALRSKDGSLGRLVLPRGMALDAENTLYLLTSKTEAAQETHEIKRLTWGTDDNPMFVALPTIGGTLLLSDEPPTRPSPARSLREYVGGAFPLNIAIVGQNLYVADTGNHRVQVFDLTTLVLRHLWGPWDAERQRV